MTDVSISIPTHADAANADALAAAWRSGTLLPEFSEPVASLEQAYRIQNAFVATAGGAGGWKVSPIRPGAPPRCAPIPRSFIRAPSQTATLDAASVLVEIEVGIRLGADLLPAGGEVGGEVTRAAVAAAIATVHPAVEIVTSRFTTGFDAPDLDRTADLQSCGGVLLGAGVADWQAHDFSQQIAELGSDRRSVQATTLQPDTGQTLDALAWLAGHAAARDLPLRAGQTIITGARLGPLTLHVGRAAYARVGALGTIELLAAPSGAERRS